MADHWLILETSGRGARVGLSRDGAVIHKSELDAARRHAREMMPTVRLMLETEGLKPTDLAGIMASRGPGSYTGLRVGLATAKALAYATGRPLVAVDTFAAIAEQAPADTATLSVVSDALQGQVYAQRFARVANGWQADSPLRILAVSEFVAELAEGGWLSGPGVAVYEGQLPSAHSRVAGADREPRVESVLAVGLRLQPLTKEELFALEPLYLRGSSAEEKAKNTG